MPKQSDSREQLLKLVKKNGHLTLNQAIKLTNLSRTTLREHFNNLEYDGYLQRSTKREGRGRPELIFELTETGHKLFPSGDGLILRLLISYLRDHDKNDDLVSFFNEFWQKRGDELQHHQKHTKPGTLAAKADLLRDFLDEQGFMPNVSVSGTDAVVVEECNCPFTETVKETHLPCKLEARFLQNFFSASLKRITYIPDGSHACTYQLKLAKGKK